MAQIIVPQKASSSSSSSAATVATATTAAAAATPAAAAPVVMSWYWEHDNGGDVWSSYDHHCDALLEKAYDLFQANSRKNKFDMRSSNNAFEWTIDFAKMTQTNKSVCVLLTEMWS